MQNRTDTLLARGLVLLLIAVTWIFVPVLANAFVVKTHLAVLGLLTLAVIVRATRQTHARPDWRDPAWIGLALLWAAVSVSALVAPDGWLAATAWLEFTVFALLVFMLRGTDGIDTVQRAVENGLLVAAGGVALFALKQLLLPAFLDPGFHALGKMKIYSTLGNPNLAALILLPALPVAAYRCWLAIHGTRLGYLALTLLLLGGLLATQSRHALLALAVMALAAGLWAMPARRRSLAIGALGLMALGGLAALWWMDLPATLLHSIKGRWFIWNTAFQMMADHPWAGVGPGHFGLFHPDAQAAMFSTGLYNGYFDNAALIEEAHNQFLHWGSTTGVAGLLGFTILCVTVLWKGWQSPAVRERAPHLYLALIGCLVAMLFVATLAYTAVALVFWLLLGLLWRHLSGAPHETQTPVRWRAVAVVVLLVPLVAAGLWSVREMRAGYHEAQGDLRMQEHDLWQASREYETAYRICPDCGSLPKKYASALFLSGETHQALVVLDKAKRHSGDIALRILEGEILTRLDRLDEAVAVYRQISAIFPKMVSPRFILAQIYLAQGKTELAGEEFARVAAIEPSPWNLNLTHDKVDLQQEIARAYLRQQGERAPRSGSRP